jgi:hypothetical protein
MRPLRSLVVLASAVTVSAILPAVPSVALAPDKTPPTLQITDLSWKTFYPVADGYRDLVKVTYTVSDDSTDTSLSRNLQITDSQGQVVFQRVAEVSTPGRHTFRWDGRSTAGQLQPNGVYTITLVVTDSARNDSTARSRTVTLSDKRLVNKTYRSTVSAGGSTVDRQVGRCSTIRKPSLHGWDRSLGYYSNTRCRGGTGDASVAATVNGTHVPRAFQRRYGTMKINVYGGAAPTARRSRGLLEYYNQVRNDWVGFKLMSPDVRSHGGETVAGKPMVHPVKDGRPYVIWAFLTASGHRYDVKTFTLVLKYQVLR